MRIKNVHTAYTMYYICTRLTYFLTWWKNLKWLECIAWLLDIDDVNNPKRNKSGFSLHNCFDRFSWIFFSRMAIDRVELWRHLNQPITLWKASITCMRKHNPWKKNKERNSCILQFTILTLKIENWAVTFNSDNHNCRSEILRMPKISNFLFC